MKFDIDRVRFLNKYTLYLLTYFKDNPYKRDHYFRELVANLPKWYHRFHKQDMCIEDSICYLKTFETEEFELSINGHRLYHRMTDLLCSFFDLNTIVVLTDKFRLFSAEKNGLRKIQHTSFNRGGYVIFAGYWEVVDGVIKRICAQSGHYEPSIVSFQNFVRYLYMMNVDLTQSCFVYVHRKLIYQESGAASLEQNHYDLPLEQLLSDNPIEQVSIPGALVTPKKLEIIPWSMFKQKDLSQSLKNECSEAIR